MAVGEVDALVEVLRRLVFPGFFEPPGTSCPGDEPSRPALAALVAEAANRLTAQLKVVSVFRPAGSPLDVPGVTRVLLERLVEVRRLLALDVQAAYDGDPAAENLEEIVLCYPGVDAIFAHRVAHELYVLGVPVLPRMIAERAHSRTGIDIHPGAQIGESVFIDHGSGTVIGETSVIGRNVKIYQGVTLGSKSFPKDASGNIIRKAKRHPTIGDRVALYAGAVILGGDTVIGDDCVVAGGVFVVSSVPPGHIVRQNRAELTLRMNPEAARRAGADEFAPDAGWGI